MRRRFKKIFRWLIASALVLLLLVSSIILLFRLPVVQKYIIDEVTTFLSDELKTEVRIEGVSLALFDKVIFENFYVEDQGGEQLIFAKYLEANFNTGLWALLHKQLELNEVTLRHAELNTKRKYGQLSDNLQYIVDYFEQRQKIRPAYQKPGEFIFNIKKVLLYDFSYNRYDELKGVDLQTHIDRGILDFNEISIPYLHFDAKSIRLDAPSIIVRNFEPPRALVSFDSLLIVPDTILYPDSSFWDIAMERFDIVNGYFKLDNDRTEPVKIGSDSTLNYRHLEVFDIDGLVNDFLFKDEVFSGKIGNLDFNDLSGFILEPSKVEQFLISDKGVELLGLRLNTPHTSLGDTLIFRYDEYSDFSKFTDDVEMRLNFKESYVRLDDIITFAPALANNTFFARNRRLRLNLDGSVNGSINDMNGDNLNISLGDGSRLRGNYTARNLTSPGQQELYLRFQPLNMRVSTLRRILPNFDLPANFDKLGQLYYTGRFDMIFNDFILDGELRSELGYADLDIKLSHSPKGLDDATYSGSLALNDFDLERWTENSDFGKITLTSEVKEGRGLTGETADARLSAALQSFEYRGYKYENAQFTGRLNQRLFNGDVSLKDDNIAFDFKGKLDYTKEQPLFDFDADIERLHLKALNLAKQDFQLEGSVDLRIQNDKPAEMIGSAFVQDFKLSNSKYSERIDSMRIQSDIDNRGIRTINLLSDALDADITGYFDLASLPNTVMAALHRNFPTYVQRLKLKEPKGQIDSIEQFTSHISIKNSGDFTKFFEPKLDTLKDISLVTYFDNTTNELELDLDAPAVIFDTLRIEGAKVSADFEGKAGTLNVDAQKIVLKNGKSSEPLSIRTELTEEDLSFKLNYAPKIDNLVRQLDLGGQIQMLDSTQTRITLDPDELSLLSSNWRLNEDNYIEFGNKKVTVKNFLFEDDQDRSIRLHTTNNKDLNLVADGFHFGIIDTFWNYPILDFGGDFDLNASIIDVFEMKGISVAIQADSFLINGDDYGNMTLNATADDLESRLYPNISITKDTMSLGIAATYNLPNYISKARNKNAKTEQPQYFDMNLSVAKYPLAFLEYFLGHSISKTIGTINGKLFLNGFLPQPKVSGYATVLNGATTIDFLQSRFHVHNQTAVIDDKCICANNGMVTDMNGNEAYVQGGITHKYLKKLGLDVRMRTANDQFVALNTEKGDNDVFYGRGMGSGTIEFTGPFSQTDIAITATTGKGTKITIPVSYDKAPSENRFIVFSDPKETEERDTIIENATELRGVKMNMDLTLTDVAEVDLIFDEKAGDIIRGRGNGNVQIELDRTQEMMMYGDYTIVEGEYLFTLMNTINKPFRVRRGGKIKWTGDPFNANIDIQAEYAGIRTPVAGLVQEYLGFASSAARDAARTPTDVDLLMQLSGELLKPNINFDISFPSLQGSLRSYAENKVRTLRQDQSALNRQVFGLITLGQFIPSELTVAQSPFGLIGNTLSELLENQLSILLTDFFSDIVGKSKVISGLDIDLAYNTFEAQDIEADEPLIEGEEYQFIGKAKLFNDRWEVAYGPSIQTGTGGSTSSSYGHDAVIEYLISKDGRIKFRIANIHEPSIISGSENRTSAGISFEREADTIKDLLRSIANKEVKVQEEDSN